MKLSSVKQVDEGGKWLEYHCLSLVTAHPILQCTWWNQLAVLQELQHKAEVLQSISDCVTLDLIEWRNWDYAPKPKEDGLSPTKASIGSAATATDAIHIFGFPKKLPPSMNRNIDGMNQTFWKLLGYGWEWHMSSYWTDIRMNRY